MVDIRKKLAKRLISQFVYSMDKQVKKTVMHVGI